MLSNKMTFSLTCLVVLIGFGLVVFVPSVMADGANNTTHFDLKVSISAGESMIDVSAEDNIQIATGRDRASRVIHNPGEAATVDANTLTISLVVEFSHVVNLAEPGAGIPLEDIDESTDNEPKPSGGDFGADDLYVAAYDNEGRSLGVLSLAEASAAGTSISQFRDTGGPGRLFLVRIDESQLRNAYIGRGATSGFEIYSLVFFIPKGISGTADADLAKGKDATVTRGIRKYDREHAIKHFGPDAHQHMNDKSNEFQVDLVDDDQGDAQYAVLTGPTSARDIALTGLPPNDDPAANRGSGTPGVVSIMRIVDRAGFIETGDFDVRIILTEEPKDGLTADMVMATNASVTSVVKGATYKGGHPERVAITGYIPAGTDPVTPAVDLPAVGKMDSELGPAMVMYYHVAGDATEVVAGTNPIPAAPGTTADNGTVANFPEATGRDNMYHSYIATISPNADVNGMVTVSVKAFDDHVLPVPNRYVPLTAEQREATTLTGAAMFVRDARVKNESLSVRVQTEKHQDRVDLMAAWKARRDHEDDPRSGLFNLSPHVKEIVTGDHRDLSGGKVIIPAGGYLVLATGGGGIAGSPAALKRKLTAEQEAYNLITFTSPFPAADLEAYFRNGGTLHLIYSDIPESTTALNEDGDQIIGPSHTKGDAGEKEADTDHKDYTGYDGADSVVHTEGSVLISEVMWGLDITSTSSQYIELHNPGTEVIELDPLEWVIVAGSVPSNLSDFTVIDTIGNNPSTGYWPVPGSSGVAGALLGAEIGDVEDIPVVARGDLVSMSRVSDASGALAADGTAQASWAASMRPSVNLAGRRIGTPGAANTYVMAPEPPPPPPTPTAAVATGAEIMISEVMIASDGGRLPQWIELANLAAGEVSLSGWSLEVRNDAADAEVVGKTIRVSLGDVTVGKDQVALVVTKAGRNSGIGTADGDLRADRIIDVQSQVSPTDARYSLISEMAFTITLLPPQTGGVVDDGDAVGNLGQGWELPMAEGNNRSSLIRREMGKTSEIMGTDAAGWVLASSTNLDGAYRTTYYGNDEDAGTPGYNAGGALPVELSKFGAKRDPVSGQAIVTWETQSELNNAGFFIKRSQQRDGQFVVVNPTMIPGAGTTSEKQTYTYTDTTAKPNIVYYYQIEDVSLDGNRQTLTRGHRLKGHIGAAGKATTLWGELKEQQ